ncbi:MAG: hypothetical protein WAM28_03660 [Chlamydiales bacterium]
MKPALQPLVHRLKSLFTLKSSPLMTRNLVYFLFLGCLLFPILFMVVFAPTGDNSEGLIVVILLLALISAIGGWYLLKFWESKMQRSVSELLKAKMAHLKELREIKVYQEERDYLIAQIEEMRRGYEHQIDLLQSSVAKSKTEVHHLNLEMDKKLEEMRIAYLEFEDLRKEYHRLETDYQQAIEEIQKELRHKESLNKEYQRTITEQRNIIEKKQGYIVKLERKVQNLIHEIRSILQLEQSSTDVKSPLDTSLQQGVDTYRPLPTSKSNFYDLSLQLQRYAEKAENLTGAEHLGYIGGNSPRFLDMSFDGYAIDRRRLLDTFGEETNGILFIYSQVEKKLLFVTPHVKILLGWSVEKFMKEFPSLVVKGFPEWKMALANTHSVNETQASLIIQSKSNRPEHFDCHMTRITKGPFMNHVLGIFSSFSLKG